MLFLIETTFIIGLTYLLTVPNYNINLLRKSSLAVSYILLLEIILFGLETQLNSTLEFGSVVLPWIQTPLFNLNYTFTLDSLSYFFMLLSAVLIPLCVLSSWSSIRFRIKYFLICVFLVEFILINMFAVGDLLLFYVWFEAVLLPMFVLIGVWGSRQRKTYASFMFFFYTFIGSLFLLFALFTLYANTNSLQLFTLIEQQLSWSREQLAWICLMLAFAVKVPMFPAHIWLPEAHVEAPTVGSVLLAGILLKLGVFAILRFLIPIFPEASFYFAPLVYVFALLGILYVSCTTMRQTDLKKIIAYASVAHMNYVVLGLFVTNVLGLSGAVFLMIGHGIVSAGLFFMVGFLYDRYKTRVVRYYRGLVTFMPIYSLFFFILTLANMSFPGTCNFVGEALILFGVIQNNILAAWLAAVGIIFCAVYSIWLFNRIMYGPVTPSILNFSDLSYKELVVLLPLVVLTILLGIYPNFVLLPIEDFIYNLLEYYN